MIVGEWWLLGAAGALAVGGVTHRQRHVRRVRRTVGAFHFPFEGRRILILSASIGGGHNAAAAVLREDLEAAGCHVAVMDGFAFATPLLSRYFAWSYPLELRYTPWLYDLQFWTSHWRWWARLSASVYAKLAGASFASIVRELRPDLVISTYPLVTQALGALRQAGEIRVPAVAVITDYGVHRLWTAPGIDLHLVPSSVSAQQVQDATGFVTVMQPLVRRAFRKPLARETVRTRLGLAPEEFVVLIVAGAWGIGRVEEIVRDVLACDVRAIVVCGRNQALFRQLAREHQGDPRLLLYGWTDELPELMVAADCLVQNAGGLTCLEAIAVGLPIVMYRPIAGHGVFNALTMEKAGAACWARTRQELHALLSNAAAGHVPLPRPRIDADAVPAAEAILSLLERPQAHRDSVGGASTPLVSRVG